MAGAAPVPSGHEIAGCDFGNPQKPRARRGCPPARRFYRGGHSQSASTLSHDPQGINDQDPDSVVDFATRACRPEADALLCSCTAWRSVEAVGAIGARTGKPVVSSNQSTIWAALRAVGLTQPIVGYGRLLEHLAAVPTAA